MTRHPAYGSPLIDAGSSALVAPDVTTDQRGEGFVRIAGPSTDIGAIELQPVTTVINQSATQPDPTPTGPIRFTVAFSAPVTGFTTSDLDFTGSTSGGTLAATISGSGKDYTVTVTGMTTTGDVVVSIPAGAAVNALGVPNQASVSTDNVVDSTSTARPRRSTSAASQADPTSVDPIRFDVVFNEPVTGFDAADVSLAGTTTGGSLTATVTGSGASYTVSISGMIGTGVVVVSVPEERPRTPQDIPTSPPPPSTIRSRSTSSSRSRPSTRPPASPIRRTAPSNSRFSSASPSSASNRPTSTSPGAPSAANCPPWFPGRDRRTW